MSAHGGEGGPGVREPRAIGTSTRVIALLGDPVAHSLSPLIQNAAFEAAGVDGIFVALRCAEGELPGLLRGLALAGGGGNVTLPHKGQAAAALDEATDAVRRTGACNTFWMDGGKVHGDNTDVEGLRRTLRGFVEGPLSGRSVLLLGAGGAARAALSVLVEEDAGAIAIFNRSVDRARSVARRLGGDRTRVIQSRGELEGGRFDLVINGTRLGLSSDDPLPVDPGGEVEAGSVLDMVYGPEETPLVRRARSLGLPALDGVEMLLQQGAAAFERWWGTPAPVEAMRAALTEVRAP
jgi:shikimate dehydrogenase